MAFQLIEQGTPCSFHPDDVIYKADYLVTEPCVFLILSGEVELTRSYTPLKKETFDYTQGDLFGMLEVYTGSERLTMARAKTAVQAVGFSRQQLEKNMSGNLKFALLAIRNLSSMLRQINAGIKKLD